MVAEDEAPAGQFSFNPLFIEAIILTMKRLWLPKMKRLCFNPLFIEAIILTYTQPLEVDQNAIGFNPLFIEAIILTLKLSARLGRSKYPFQSLYPYIVLRIGVSKIGCAPIHHFISINLTL